MHRPNCTDSRARKIQEQKENFLDNTLVSAQKSDRFFANLASESVAQAEAC
jgi:hypothetical protein